MDARSVPVLFDEDQAGLLQRETQITLENALIDAGGAVVVADGIIGSHGGSWAELGRPRKGFVVMVMTEHEKQAFIYVSDALRKAVADVSRRFYTKPGETV